jgi:GNAT superfamily N-acetyltransferase
MQLTECSHNDYNKLANAITRFNLEHLPVNSSNNMRALGFVLRPNPWSVVAGVTGHLVLGNCLSIEILWVEPEHRKKGYATQLMQAIESAARDHGSKLAFVDTFDFQALGFYQKIGYELFGVLDDCPCPGNKRYYLKKVL